jgi:hypothetical protein
VRAAETFREMDGKPTATPTLPGGDPQPYVRWVDETAVGGTGMRKAIITTVAALFTLMLGTQTALAARGWRRHPDRRTQRLHDMLGRHRSVRVHEIAESVG